VGPIEENKYQKADKDWHECMLRVGRGQTQFFEQHNVEYTEVLIHTNCTRSLMKWIYQHLVGRKMLVPIEKLDSDVKAKMWAFVKEICAGKINDVEKMKDIARVFYTIEYFLNQQNI